ncbi:winged helix-turn-helix domain-containing protein [Phenylobacterium soli]|uniref:winged helix-turn-helix domain-containing protein n=1 Tax=Phenylobacterium soli TaxID=2170551 RepID=UPI003607C833
MGGLSVQPALRRVTHPDGRQQILQPRVMQVLVALARAEGEILSRDELLATCWPGMVVGEDALNRVIGQLRKLCDHLTGGELRIETITKVGYRLVGAGLVAAAAAALAGDGDPLLAVLAFDNLSGDADFLYFSDGISEEVLLTVAKTTGLRVLGRSSSFHYRGADKSVRRVADELGATHVLDGAVRRAGDSVRISVELVDCASQTTVWTDRFDRRLADVFTLQDEIAAHVAAALKAKFAPSVSAGPIDPAAFDLVLRARAPGPDLIGFNAPLLEQAVALAPDFAEAWALLAFARAISRRWLGVDAAQASALRRGAMEAAERALALDPRAAHAYLALEMIEPMCGAYAKRLSLVDLALAAAPNDPMVLTHMAGLHDILGHQALAYSYIARAYRLDPRYAAFYLPYLQESVGLRQEARSTLDRDVERWPDIIVLHIVAMRFAVEAGDWARFERERAVLPPESLASPIVRGLLLMAERVRGWSPAIARQVVDELRTSVAQTGTAPLGGLGLPAGLGLAGPIYDILEDASFDHLYHSEGLLTSGETALNVLFTASYEAMRADPRFVRLCVKLGLAEYWAASDHWPDFAAEVAPIYDLKAEVRRLLDR